MFKADEASETIPPKERRENGIPHAIFGEDAQQTPLVVKDVGL